MEIPLQLILTACIVNFGSTHAAVQAIASKEVNDESEIRQNFRNLIDSIGRNNTLISNAYLETLKEESVRERQAFYKMMDEFRIARSKNFNKINFYGKSVAAIKRETSEGPSDTGGDDKDDSSKDSSESRSPIFKSYVIIKWTSIIEDVPKTHVCALDSLMARRDRCSWAVKSSLCRDYGCKTVYGQPGEPFTYQFEYMNSENGVKKIKRWAIRCNCRPLVFLTAGEGGDNHYDLMLLYQEDDSPHLKPKPP